MGACKVHYMSIAQNKVCIRAMCVSQQLVKLLGGGGGGDGQVGKRN